MYQHLDGGRAPYANQMPDVPDVFQFPLFYHTSIKQSMWAGLLNTPDIPDLYFDLSSPTVVSCCLLLPTVVSCCLLLPTVVQCAHFFYPRKN